MSVTRIPQLGLELIPKHLSIRTVRYFRSLRTGSGDEASNCTECRKVVAAVMGRYVRLSDVACFVLTVGIPDKGPDSGPFESFLRVARQPAEKGA